MSPGGAATREEYLDTGTPRPAFGYRAGRLPRSLALWASFGVLAARVLSVDIFPVITNDSVSYLQHSDDLGGFGAIWAGYRQFGYPLFLAVVDMLGSATGVEALVLTAFLQRALLVSSLLYATWLWRFWALPAVFLFTTPTLTAYTNLILTEGLAIPLAILLASLLAHVIKVCAEEELAPWPVVGGLSLMTTTVLTALVSIRLQYALLGTAFVALLYTLARAGGWVRRLGLVLAIVALATGLAMVVPMSVENRNEFGVLMPSVRGERSAYWATWQTVFREPSARLDSRVIDLYADGDPYAFIREVESLPDYEEQKAAFTGAIDRMVEASGRSIAAQRFAAVRGVIQGGRTDDLQGIVMSIAEADPSDIDEAIYWNALAREIGPEAFVDRFNRGRDIEPVVVSPIAPDQVAPYFGTVLALGLPLAAIALATGIAVGRTRTLAASGLTTLIATVLVFSYLLMDNVRFLLVQEAFVVVAATGTVHGLWQEWRQRVVTGPTHLHE